MITHGGTTGGSKVQQRAGQATARGLAEALSAKPTDRELLWLLELHITAVPDAAVRRLLSRCAQRLREMSTAEVDLLLPIQTALTYTRRS